MNGLRVMQRNLFPAGVFLFSLMLLASTSEMLPLVWDEGELIDRAENIGKWLDAPTLTEESIKTHWKAVTVAEGHPAGYAVVMAVGKKIADFFPFLPPKTAWRFGPMLLMSLAAAVMFRRLQKEYGWTAGVFAVSAVFCLPRVFAHAHLATCDSSLMAAWILCVAFFPDLTGSSRTKTDVMNVLLWGGTLGLTFSMKFTGGIAAIPFFLFGLIMFPRKKRFLPILGLLTAALMFYLLNPPLWFHPVSGFTEFVRLNMHRDKFNIAILFLGRMYDLHHSLPWYNTLVWVFLTIPVPFLFLLMSGIGSVFRERRRHPLGILLLLHGLILLVIRAFPGLPPHDGTRLFIAGFPFLGILIGLGAARWWSKGRFLKGVVMLFFLTAAGNMFLFAPQWLSYYSGVLGGLSGAVRHGMEATYYWDALDRDVISWLNANTEPGRKVHFAPASSKTLRRVREWDNLRPNFEADAPGEYQWYVIQRRPSAVSPQDARLFRHAEPVYVKTVRSMVFPPWRISETPVLFVFAYSDLEQPGSPDGQHKSVGSR
ncbi:MAG: glycosyltransferase family 39 protein [Planctomycetaceae bacterium]|jgi:hypothetical protein|nr:glycosyltransferase family 39 protein [Planctomycetaceae bacterium]